MTEPRPDVTAIIPTLNRSRLLSRAVASALRQEDVAVEVIVVDDGSTDETPERLARIADERLRVIRSETRGGVSRARNIAVEAARAHWVAFLDDDDVWAPRKLRAQLDSAADDVALVCSGAVFIDRDGVVLSERLPEIQDEDYAEALLSTNAVGSPSGVLAQKELVRAVGGFDESLPRSQDWDLWIRLAREGRVVACREILYAYMVHAGAASAGDQEQQAADHERIRTKYAPEFPVEPDPVAYSRWVAGHQRESGRRLDAIRTYLSSGIRDRDPGNLLRGSVLVLGERALRTARRVRKGKARRPPWLDEALGPSPFDSSL
jgi:glycosyltransferase involved in cell wall biosynthesis